MLNEIKIEVINIFDQRKGIKLSVREEIEDVSRDVGWLGNVF